jgi:hypothetical protein
MGRVKEEKRRVEERRSEKRNSQKKEDPGTGSVTWRDYWLISGRKADHLECVPACIYQCH